MQKIEPIRWSGNTAGTLHLLDQTLLPGRLVELDFGKGDLERVFEAIQKLRVRGAPAIGISAAYGVCVGVMDVLDAEKEAFLARAADVIAYLRTSRPTAVNLFWALDRMAKVLDEIQTSMPANEFLGQKAAEMLLAEAKEIHEEDRRLCASIGRHGAALLETGTGVLTHCNAGALATGGDGTALAVIYAAVAEGKNIHVYADETRPLLQGARLTAWELVQRQIPVTLICDNMAAKVMQEGRVQAVVVGADRIASNGDAANKIGTYGVACLAAAHGIPFYVAAPTSTFDLAIMDGAEIPIEERDPREITHGFGCQTAPDGVGVYNPAFDVTPARLIRGIITENGVISPVTRENVLRNCGGEA